MGIFDEVFGSKELEVVKSVFPSEEEVNEEVAKTEKYKLSLAERYANSLNISVTEAKAAIEEGRSQELLSEKTDTNYTPVLNNAYATGQTPEEFKKTLDTYRINTEMLLKAGDSKDVIEGIIIDKFNPKVDNRGISQAILTEEFQKVAPDEGFFGTVGSFFGMLFTESTVGAAENFLGVAGESVGDWKGKSQFGREALQAMLTETDLDKKRLIARDLARQAKERGIFGDNSFNYWSVFETIKSGGTGQAEEIWLALDVAGLIPFGKAFGLTGKGLKTTGTAAKLSVATDALEMGEATGGKVAANNILDTALSNSETSINTAKHTAPSSSSVGSNGMGPTIKPTLSNEVSNDYYEYLRNTYKGIYSEEVLQAAKSRKKVELEKTTRYHVLDIAEKDIGFDNYTVEITMGKDNGLPFVDKINAEKFAKTLGGRVEPYGVNSAGTSPEGYVVKFDRNLNMKGLSSATELGKLRANMFDILLSPEITSSKDLNTVLKRGLDKIGAVEVEIFKTHDRIFKNIRKEDIEGIDLVISKLKTENPLNGDWYDISTFKDVFYNQTGRTATQEVIDGYSSAYKLANTRQLIEADKILKRTTGETIDQFMGSTDGQTFYRMKKLPSGRLPSGKDYGQEQILDFNTGKMMSLKDFNKGRKERTLYQIVDVDNGPKLGGKSALYATGDLKISRPLLSSDVVPKIAGGYRSTDNIHGMLTSQRKSVDLSDNPINLTPVIFGVARTAKELVRMGTETNILLKGLRDYEAGSISKELMDNLVRANNGFNPSIEDTDGLKVFFDKHGVNTAEDIQIVTKDMNLPDVGVEYFENYRLGKFTTYEDLYSKGAIDNAIMYGYGGGKFKTVDPVRAIERDFAKGVNYIAEREYSMKSVEGWLGAGVKNNLILNYSDIQNKPFYQQLKEAQLVNSKAGDKLKTERRVILNRLSESNEFAQAWDRRMAGLGEWIFDTSYKVGGKGLDVIDRMTVRPDVFLRSLAFDMKMGTFNPDQFVVQASSAMNIMAISPMNGLKAAASYLPLRAAMLRPDPETIREVYKRSGSFIGMTEEEFIESIAYLRKSGRFEVNQNITELNNTANITKGAINKFREKGRVFFNEGERVQRLMASNVAYREFRKAYPVLDVTTDVGFRIMDDFITNRADALTMNMTRASAAWWQQGFMSLPTQWLSYQAKLMENIFFGANLAKDERIRLGLSQLVMFGGAGIPLGGWAVNSFVDETSEGIDKDAYTFFRYGLLDLTLSKIIGEPTALSARLGIGDGLIDLYRNFLDKNFAQLIGGPSLAIAWDTTSSAITGFSSLFNSDIEITQYDIGKVLRHVSTFDKVAKDYYLIQTGEFINKKGQVLAEGMNPWNALWNTLGIPFQEVELYYDLKQAQYAESQMVKGVTDRTKELVRLQNKYTAEGDIISAVAISNEIRSLHAPLTSYQKSSVDRFSRESYRTLAETVILQESKTATEGLARQLQKLISKEEE
jgi:hypothetical protein